MRLTPRTRPPRSPRGSALVMAIIISVVITGLVLTVAWASSVQAEMAGKFANTDQAFYSAESGAQLVAWYCKHSKIASATSPLSGTVGGFGYSASWSTVSGSTIRVTSNASLNGIGYTCYQTVSPPSTGAPALANSGNGNISGTVTVSGNQETNGAINANANLKITGNLSAGGAINGTPVVGGTKKQNATGLAPPAVSTIYTTEKNIATKTLTTPSSISVFDFTTASNGVIYVNGDANMYVGVTVIGSGTIVVSGNWNQSSSFPATGTATANVIVLGDLNISGAFNIKGSLYGGKNWNQSGPFTITGAALITNDANVSGSGTITLSTLPSFDPRGSGGTGGTSLTSFTGPNP